MEGLEEPLTGVEEPEIVRGERQHDEGGQRRTANPRNRNSRSDETPKATLYITGFIRGSSARDLARIFERYGPIAQVNVLPPRPSDGQQYGFVAFRKIRDMENILGDVENGKILDEGLAIDPSRGISVQKARKLPVQKRTDRRGERRSEGRNNRDRRSEGRRSEGRRSEGGRGEGRERKARGSRDDEMRDVSPAGRDRSPVARERSPHVRERSPAAKEVPDRSLAPLPPPSPPAHPSMANDGIDYGKGDSN